MRTPTTARRKVAKKTAKRAPAKRPAVRKSGLGWRIVLRAKGRVLEYVQVYDDGREVVFDRRTGSVLPANHPLKNMSLYDEKTGRLAHEIFRLAVRDAKQS